MRLTLSSRMSGGPVYISIISFGFFAMSAGAVDNKLNISMAAEGLNLFKGQPLVFQADKIKSTPCIVYITVGSNTGFENVRQLCCSNTNHLN